MVGMPTSRAYEAFEFARVEAHLLRSTEVGRAITSRDRLNAGNRAATVVLCSHLEGYVESVFLEGWESVEREGVLVGSLPPDLRRQVFLVEGRQLFDKRHDKGFEKKVEDFFSSWGHLLESGMPFDLRKSRADCLPDQLNTPSPEHISILFRAYGIEDIFEMIESITEEQILAETLRRGVGDLVNARHAIAHGDSSAIPTDGDVNRYSKVASLACRHIDAALGIRLEEISGTFPWTGMCRNCAVPPPGEIYGWLF